ncbi:hypothetical protein MTR67_026736 [Solanum verrucosum]|uniref:Uncharacterized protein n=1 Tax=Solanum verrucosum TaxID=315347 RepID=A0AAF0TUS4_SOLVR|nr:hypothetical protein MTR67_026735 [Solanum verrucosum]WMV33351.1 hypothetical protein MTR67_026736 [Solanum verrucosum]
MVLLRGTSLRCAYCSLFWPT